MGDCFNCCILSDEQELIPSDSKANFKGPVKRRSRTDSSFLGIFLFVLISLFGLVVYCTIYSDINRLFYGFDKCGDVCGVKNVKNPDPKFCAGKDMTNKPFLKIDHIYEIEDLKHVKGECVESCSKEKNFVEFFHRCIPSVNKQGIVNNVSESNTDKSFQEITQDLEHTLWEIVFLCIFAFVASLAMVISLRFVAGIFVWSILIGIVVGFFSISVFFWTIWNEASNNKTNNLDQKYKDNDDHSTQYLICALIASIVTLVSLIIIVAMRRRIALVIQLFKESGKAIQSMPLLLVQPMVTFFFLCLAIFAWSYSAVLIESSGFLAIVPQTQNAYYKMDHIMKFARVYNGLVLLWVIEFIIGCQHMIIAGSVATWFFTRNKDNVLRPISTSIGYLFNYHLGSVALGSLVLTVVKIIKAIFHSIIKSMNKNNNASVQEFLNEFKLVFDYVQGFLQYLTRNAYIEIAIYGENFCRSGQQAFKVITSNILRIYSINSIGDLVLFIGKVIVVILTVLLGYQMLETKQGVHNLWVPLSVVAIFAYFVAHCFMSVYEMVIDTIFVCFCEDCNLNDGVSQEYYMSKELMEFVEKSKKMLKVGDASNN